MVTTSLLLRGHLYGRCKTLPHSSQPLIDEGARRIEPLQVSENPQVPLFSFVRDHIIKWFH
jgi:hypothetical protein